MSFPLGNMKAMTYMQYLEYKQAVNIYLTVEAYNLNIYTQRQAGNTGVSYYVFQSATEETQYKQGHYILVQNDPRNVSKYNPIEKI